MSDIETIPTDQHEMIEAGSDASDSCHSVASDEQPILSMMKCTQSPTCILKRTLFYVVALLSGFIFAIGLGLSNMTYPAKVLRFLAITSIRDWDPSLGFVMGGGLVITIIAFQLLLRILKKPVLFGKFCLPTNREIERKIIIGPIIFGVGWGLAGICPGPGIVGLVATNTKQYVWFIGVVAGIYAENIFGKFLAIHRAAQKTLDL